MQYQIDNQTRYKIHGSVFYLSLDSCRISSKKVFLAIASLRRFNQIYTKPIALFFVSSMILEVHTFSGEDSYSSVKVNLNLFNILSPTFSRKLRVTSLSGKVMVISDSMISLSRQYLDSLLLPWLCTSMAKSPLVLKHSKLSLLRNLKVILLVNLALPSLRQICFAFSLLIIDLWQNSEQSSLVSFLALAVASFSRDWRLKLNCDLTLTILLMSLRLAASRKKRSGLCLGGTGRIFLLSQLLTIDLIWLQDCR